jgi:FMN phosphatase YigB (HAD superfamily)
MAKEEKKQKIVIFNLSGALLLPFDKKITLWCDAIRACSAPLEESLIYQNYQKSFHKEIIPLLAEAGNWSQQQRNEVIVTARGSFDNDKFVSLAGLAENMNSLKKVYDLGVVTNRSNRELEESLLSLGLRKSCFRIIHTADEGVYKPDPRVFKTVLKDYRKEDILYVGAAKNDLLVAQKAGVKFWGLTSSTCPQGLFWAYGLTPEQTFSSITDAMKNLLEE